MSELTNVQKMEIINSWFHELGVDGADFVAEGRHQMVIDDMWDSYINLSHNSRFIRYMEKLNNGLNIFEKFYVCFKLGSMIGFYDKKY